MRLYEFEGKELFREMCIPIPENVLITSVEEALEKVHILGFPVVVKAQVLRGGRGKAGLVKTASNPDELRKVTADILSKISCNEYIMLEKFFQANQEGYIGITVDDLKGQPILVISKMGGINVEDSAKTSDSGFVYQYIDPIKGIYQHQILLLAKKAGFSGKIAVKIAHLGTKLYSVFERFDCDTAEINPVLINDDTQKIVAGDAKIIIDDYSLPRQPTIKKFKRKKELSDSGIFFVKLGGNIGIISGGASVTMMVCDSIKIMGGEPANFLDSVGGSTVESVAEKARVVIKEANNNLQYKVILINYGISALSLKTVVEGICLALKETKSRVPLIASIRATSASISEMSLPEAKSILKNYGVDCRPTLLDAINTAIRIARS